MAHPSPETSEPAGRERFASFEAFYTFYLGEHRNVASRRLHVIGTGLAVLAVATAPLLDWRLVLAAPLLGYGFAWLGHAVFEKNRPATFRYAIWSLRGDVRLFVETVSGRRKF